MRQATNIAAPNTSDAVEYKPMDLVKDERAKKTSSNKVGSSPFGSEPRLNALGIEDMLRNGFNPHVAKLVETKIHSEAAVSSSASGLTDMSKLQPVTYPSKSSISTADLSPFGSHPRLNQMSSDDLMREITKAPVPPGKLNDEMLVELAAGPGQNITAQPHRVKAKTSSPFGSGPRRNCQSLEDLERANYSGHLDQLDATKVDHKKEGTKAILYPTAIDSTKCGRDEKCDNNGSAASALNLFRRLQEIKLSQQALLEEEKRIHAKLACLMMKLCGPGSKN